MDCVGQRSWAFQKWNLVCDTVHHKHRFALFEGWCETGPGSFANKPQALRSRPWSVGQGSHIWLGIGSRTSEVLSALRDNKSGYLTSSFRGLVHQFNLFRSVGTRRNSNNYHVTLENGRRERRAAFSRLETEITAFAGANRQLCHDLLMIRAHHRFLVWAL